MECRRRGTYIWVLGASVTYLKPEYQNTYLKPEYHGRTHENTWAIEKTVHISKLCLECSNTASSNAYM